MKPIILKIKGLNSFCEEQTINFEDLVGKGIFGIFGPTGSGKSTIIDAMTLALYGSVSRYDGTNAGKAFVNTNAENMSVTFEFSLKGKDTVFYEVKREYKRKTDGTFKSPSARLIKKNCHEDIDVIADKPNDVTKQIIKIIGLEYNDFTRSVILPQGKFSEFLMLENKNRRDMLERIFGLEEYGSVLTAKINEKRNFQKKKVDNLNSKLEVYGNVSEEIIKDYKRAYNDEILQINKIKSECQEKENKFEKIKGYFELKKEFDFYIIEKNKLKALKDDMESKDFLLKQAERADKVFPCLKRYKEICMKYDESLKSFINEKKAFEDAFAFAEEKKVLFIKYSEEKEKEYPDLLKKDADLEQALNLKKYVDDIILEREKLRGEFKNNEALLKNVKKLLEKETKEKKLLNEELKEIEDEKKKLFVSPQFRKEIENAANIEKKYFETTGLLQNEIKLKDKKLKEVNVQNEQLEKLLVFLKDAELEYNDKKKQKEIIEKNNFYDLNYIVNKQKELLDKKNNFYAKKEKYEKLPDLKNELEEKAENQKLLENEIDNIIKETEKNKKLFDDVCVKIELFKNQDVILSLAEKLEENEPCPVCGSVHHPSPAKKAFDVVLNELVFEKENIEEILNMLSENRQKKITEMSLNNAFLADLKEKITEISIAIDGIDFVNVEKDLNAEIEKAEKIKHDFNVWQEKKEDIEDTLNSLDQTLNKNRIKYAELNTNVIKDRETLEKHLLKIYSLEEENKANKEILDRLKEKFKIQNFAEKYSSIQANEMKRSSLEEREADKREFLDGKIKIIEDLNDKIKDYEKISESIKISGKEKTTVIEKNMLIIKQLSDEKEPKRYADEIRKRIFDLIENERILKEDYDKAEKQKNDLLQRKIEIEKENETFKNLKEEQYGILSQVLNDNNFLGEEDAEAYFIDKDTQIKFEKEINEYNDKVKEVTANLKRTNAKLQKEEAEYSETEMKGLEKDINALNDEKEKCLNNIGKLDVKIKEAEETFIKVKNLKKQLKDEVHILDLLSEILSVSQGNKFVEFMAKRQLSYITREASDRLRKMTKGRYSIELDSEPLNSGKVPAAKVEGVNFVIRDDFNGGVRRVPKSLSGGEIFLTSLSLALALSSKIQLKNHAPLEIFFLDEGFGTLDSELLDTVMYSLEQLSCEKINVGIITHVEELKNRVQSKINVVPADGLHGTRIIV